MDRETYRRRWSDFGESIRNLELVSPVVRECVIAYCNGRIETKEEALVKMVECLCESNKAQQDKIIEILQHSIVPTIVMKPKPKDILIEDRINEYYCWTKGCKNADLMVMSQSPICACCGQETSKLPF